MMFNAISNPFRKTTNTFELVSAVFFDFRNKKTEVKSHFYVFILLFSAFFLLNEYTFSSCFLQFFNIGYSRSIEIH